MDTLQPCAPRSHGFDVLTFTLFSANKQTNKESISPSYPRNLLRRLLNGSNTDGKTHRWVLVKTWAAAHPALAVGSWPPTEQMICLSMPQVVEVRVEPLAESVPRRSWSLFTLRPRTAPMIVACLPQGVEANPEIIQIISQEPQTSLSTFPMPQTLEPMEQSCVAPMPQVIEGGHDSALPQERRQHQSWSSIKDHFVGTPSPDVAEQRRQLLADWSAT